MDRFSGIINIEVAIRVIQLVNVSRIYRQVFDDDDKVFFSGLKPFNALIKPPRLSLHLHKLNLAYSETNDQIVVNNIEPSDYTLMKYFIKSIVN